MYSGAIMSAKLRASHRAHKAHCAKTLPQHYQTPQYHQEGPQGVQGGGLGGGPQGGGQGSQLCRNLSIFSGGPKMEKSTTSPTGSMERGGGNSLFPRRSQAKRQWSIQAVKGKVTTSCLWNACKALTLGIILIFIGAGMATVGYYAEEEELRRLSSNSSSHATLSPPDHNLRPHAPPLPDHSPHDVVGVNSSSPHRPLPPNAIIRGGRPPPPHANFNSHYNVVSTSSNNNNNFNANFDEETSQDVDGAGGGPGGGHMDRNWNGYDSSNNNNSGSGGAENVVPVPVGGVLPYEGMGLNKLAYVGPIVMGFGGFVIVAACVMTFEARDSAAKIVPARFRKTFPEKTPTRDEDPAVRHTSAQTKWESQGVYGGDAGSKHNGKEINRKAMTSAFIKFSKTLQTSVDSSAEYYDSKGGQQMVKCPSAPSLVREFLQEDKRQAGMEAPRILRVCAPRPQVRRLSTNVLPRKTMSVDNPAIREVYAAALPAFIGERQGDEEMELGASATAVHQQDQETNMTMDLHLPQCAVTLLVRDNPRSPSVQANIEGEYTSLCGSDGADSGMPGPSGLQLCLKVDKQTSTAEHGQLASLGWSKETNGSREGGMFSSRTSTGGSFREAKRPRANRHVKRSETIDTAATHHRRHPHPHHHHHHHSQHFQSSERTSSTRSVSGRNSADGGRKLMSSRSETGRRHQLLRQPKVEGAGSQEDMNNHRPFHV